LRAAVIRLANLEPFAAFCRIRGFERSRYRMTDPADKSARTTGNEPVDAIDPGGTKPTKGRGGKAPVKTEQHVVSGDRNDGETSVVGPTRPKP
jgi:hypothetical protein